MGASSRAAFDAEHYNPNWLEEMQDDKMTEENYDEY